MDMIDAIGLILVRLAEADDCVDQLLQQNERLTQELKHIETQLEFLCEPHVAHEILTRIRNVLSEVN
jgi:hypothetical protein